MIQLHRLEGFYWVARSGGYARAARAFPYPITQPAVHQQVKKLEGELGLDLFERLGKDKLGLTPAGRALYDFAAPFFERLPSIVRALQSEDYGGELRIHAETLLVRHLLPSWLKRLQRRRPRLALDLHETLAPDLAALRRGDMDVLVGHLPQVPPDIATMEVATLRPFVVVPRDHRVARRKSFTVRDLRDDTFIAYHERLLPFELQMKALALHDVVPERMLTAGSADTILGFVESGLGYSLVPSLDEAGPRSRGIVARPLKRPKVEFPVYMAWRKDTPENPFLDAMLETAPTA